MGSFKGFLIFLMKLMTLNFIPKINPKHFISNIFLIVSFEMATSIGSVARSGWFRPAANSRFEDQVTAPVAKRHIGALAKLGWLPALRSARRFSRSGRSAPELVEDDVAPEIMMS